MNQTNKKTIKAYSMVEMLVTMAIFAVIITMLLQSLLLNLKLSTQVNIRSKFNSDIDQLVSLIERDLRNADYYTSCNGSSCVIILNQTSVNWYQSCASGKCVVNRDTSTTLAPVPVTEYTSDSTLNVTAFDFTVNTGETGSTGSYSKSNILLTIKVKPASTTWEENYGILEQVRQISVSSRNYDVGL